MKLLDRLDQISPIQYRLIAYNKGGKLFGIDEIRKRSGLSRGTIQRVSHLKSWRGVRPEVIDSFIAGCGFTVFQNKEPLRRLQKLQEMGITRAKQLVLSKTAPLWQRGAMGNQMKYIIKAVTQ